MKSPTQAKKRLEWANGTRHRRNVRSNTGQAGGPVLCLLRSLTGHCIEVQIEFNDIDSRFAEETELASIGVLRD
jgi:hypothetical protein